MVTRGPEVGQSEEPHFEDPLLQECWRAAIASFCVGDSTVPIIPFRGSTVREEVVDEEGVLIDVTMVDDLD